MSASEGGCVKKNIYIFGAHSRAQTTAAYLQAVSPELSVEAYLYDNEEQNPESISGIKVIRACGESGLHTDHPVYIGTRGIYHQQVADRLRAIGFTDIYPVTVRLDLQLRNAYLEKHFAEIRRDFIRLDSLPEAGTGKALGDGPGEKAGCRTGQGSESAAVYIAVSKYDRPLLRQYSLAPYEKEIRTGAAVWEGDFPETSATDDRGDNISVRNRQFCELTALYWLWKHAREDIIGLAQYRRHFILPEDWLLRMQENGIDAILPVPLYVAPSIAGNYKSRHDPADWDAMMAYLKRRDIEEYREAEAFFRTNLYSPCNMLICHRQVLDELCGWLFPVLFQMAGQVGEKEDVYQNRYPGFLSERLISFFFEENHGRYKAVYADKDFRQ